jgi:predicted transposase YbfD/YdcC
MQCIPALPLLDDLSDEERSALLSDTTLRSLADVLAAVPDPRSRHGRRYTLAFLLTCLVAGMLCDCDSLEAVGQWCREHRSLLRQVLGPSKHLTPCESTFRKLLPRLSPGHLEWALASWLLHRRPSPDHEPVALDGKVVRGASQAGQQPQLLSVVTHQSGDTLAQVQIDAKTNEIPVARELLGWVLLDGRVVTADALHTHADFAQQVLDLGADYLLPVKENQPTLFADLLDYFADPASTWTEARTRERGHGRREERTVWTTTALNAHLAPFPGVAQAIRIHRHVVCRDEEHDERTYYLTSCSPQQADAVRLLALIRGHWAIERGHWIRDVDFGEDRSRIRSGSAPQILAALRNAIVTLLRHSGRSAIAAARRYFACHPRRAFSLIRRPLPPPR